MLGRWWPFEPKHITPPLLSWYEQWAWKLEDRHITHYAKFGDGFFEIFDTLDGDYLLTCPPQADTKAELFSSLDGARSAAQMIADRETLKGS